MLGASQPVYANFGVDCWDQCAETGLCPSFCGPKGACCRDGYDGLGCPQLDAACGGERHCCTTSVPLPPPSAPPPAPDEVIHTDEYCLDACGGKEGPCDFCGVNGSLTRARARTATRTRACTTRGRSMHKGTQSARAGKARVFNRGHATPRRWLIAPQRPLGLPHFPALSSLPSLPSSPSPLPFPAGAGACCMDGELVEGCPAAGGGAPFGTYGCVEIPAVTIVASLREEPTQHRRLLTRHWPAAAALAAAAGALLAAGAHRLRRRAVATPPADGESAQML